MQPGTQDITIYQGDDFDFFFRIRERVWDANANGGQGGYVPGDYVDLTGYVAKAQIRSAAGAPGNPLAEMTCTLADQENPDTVGGVLLVLSGTETASLPSTGGKWDVQLTDPSDKIQTYLRGSVAVTVQVTV